MGQCYGKNIPVAEDGEGDVRRIPPSAPATPAPAAMAGWPSPYPDSSATPLPAGVSPSPARSTPRRFFKRPFPPPSPAKHIKASLAKRHGPARPKEGPIPEDGGGNDNGEESDRQLDKRFGYGKNFGAKYEIVKEVGRGHFGHTCSARAKKGEMKGQLVAVKIISKAKVRWYVSFFFFTTTKISILCVTLPFEVKKKK